MSPTRTWLERELRNAIVQACTADNVLLGRDASERSIMFRVGLYLANAVERDSYDKLRVDLEYNRIAHADGAKVHKRVDGLLRHRGEKRSVFPDLIVHDRTGSSADHNILVIEAKKHPATPAGMEFDLRKLEAYRTDLSYRHAVYVELSPQPRWQWLGVHDKLEPVEVIPATNRPVPTTGDG